MKHPRLIGFSAAWLIIYTLLVWQTFTSRSPGGNDFIAHLTAWEAYLKRGLNPYSDEAALYTQQVIYGRPALPNEDQNRLTYPFYSIVIHGPFVLVGDYALARAIYMTALEIALVAGVIMTVKLVGWRPSSLLLALTLGWSILFYPESRGLLLGQFAIFGFCALVGSLWLARRGRAGLGGALLVLTTIKPTLVFLVVPYLLVWAIARRQWRFLAGFGMTLVALMLMSWLMLPTWLGDWLYRLGLYSDYTVGQSPIWLLTHQVWPAAGDGGEIGLAAILLALMLWVWFKSLRSDQADRFWWGLGVTLVVSNLIVPRSATTNYVLLLIPVLWLFAKVERRQWGRAAQISFMLVSLVGLWWLHAATVVGNQEQPILFVPLPTLVGLALIYADRWLQPAPGEGSRGC